MDPQGLLKILVYVVAPSQPEHAYLLLRHTPSRGGSWQAIRGPVESGEALDEAAIRELTEHKGLTPIRLVALDYSYMVSPGKRPTTHSPLLGPIIEHVFLALLSAKVDPRLDPAEHDAWDWFTYRDALTWLKGSENVEALRRCEALINPRPGDPQR